MAAHGGQHDGLLAGGVVAHVLKAQRIGHRVARNAGELAGILGVLDRGGDVDRQAQVFFRDALDEGFRLVPAVEHRRHGASLAHAFQNLLEVRLVALAPVAKDALALGRAQRTAMQSVAQAAGAEFGRDLHEALLRGEGVAGLAGRLGLGGQRKDDVVVDEAFGLAVAMQGVGHAFTISLGCATGAAPDRSRITLRPRPILVLARWGL